MKAPVALRRVLIPSPNYSSRAGASVRLVVLHTAEGARNYRDLGAFFANPASGVSSHVGIDDTPGEVGEYVQRAGKAWTAASYNPVAVQAELCAFAEWDLDEWHRHPQMLANTAQWVAEECRYFGLPVRALSPAEAQGGGAGVCQHADLGAGGGGHWDCGPAFPMADVIALAAGNGPMTLEGGDSVFIHSGRDGRFRWFIADGSRSYWRLVPDGLEQDIPPGMVIEDPNDSWKSLWHDGAP